MYGITNITGINIAELRVALTKLDTNTRLNAVVVNSLNSRAFTITENKLTLTIKRYGLLGDVQIAYSDKATDLIIASSESNDAFCVTGNTGVGYFTMWYFDEDKGLTLANNCSRECRLIMASVGYDSGYGTFIGDAPTLVPIINNVAQKPHGINKHALAEDHYVLGV